MLLVTVGGRFSKKNLRLNRFKSDRDEISNLASYCSSSKLCKYASIGGVGFLIWRHTFKICIRNAYIPHFAFRGCRVFWLVIHFQPIIATKRTGSGTSDLRRMNGNWERRYRLPLWCSCRQGNVIATCVQLVDFISRKHGSQFCTWNRRTFSCGLFTCTFSVVCSISNQRCTHDSVLHSTDSLAPILMNMHQIRIVIRRLSESKRAFDSSELYKAGSQSVALLSAPRNSE